MTTAKAARKPNRNCLIASVVAFRKKSPLQPSKSSQLTSRPIVKKDIEANSQSYHADYSLAIITAAP